MTRPYYVVSKEYGTKVPVCDDGSGPMEYGCDVAEVEARTAREALILGVRKILRDQRRSHAESQRSDGANPFVGYKAESAICPHGVPHFVIVDDRAVYMDWCPGCKLPEPMPESEMRT